VLASADPLHFPAAFPEVFDGDSKGFNVIVGNPPWERARVERHEFWARHYPGLRGLSANNREARIEKLQEKRPDLQREFEKEQQEESHRSNFLTSGPFPGMSAGDPDFYIAFCWRFWQLSDATGDVGVVLPRGTFTNAGTETFRRKVLDEGEVTNLTFLKNQAGWAFEGMEHRYTIGLFSFRKGVTEDGILPLRGPFADPNQFEKGTATEPHRFPVEEAKGWTGSASFPLLPPEQEAVEAFKRLTLSPRLDYDEEGEWRARPNRELDSAMDKTADDGTRIMHFIEDPPDDYWPVFKGASFDIWENDTGVRYAWGDPETVTEYLQEKRENSYRYAGSRSVFYEMDEEWVHEETTLSCYSPRVCFRDVTNRTNSRTVLSALVPPNVFLTDKAPYLLWPRGNEPDQAYLLGVLCSIPLDWYSRRFVETNVAYHILNGFPIPRPGREDPLRQRVVELSGRLAAVDDRYADWADSVGVEYGPLDEGTRQEKIYELDGVVAHLYDLTSEHVEVIFETFHDGWDYEERLNRVLDYYAAWADQLDLDQAGSEAERPAGTRNDD
jgi:hypothetical protein